MLSTRCQVLVLKLKQVHKRYNLDVARCHVILLLSATSLADEGCKIHCKREAFVIRGF